MAVDPEWNTLANSIFAFEGFHFPNDNFSSYPEFR